MDNIQLYKTADAVLAAAWYFTMAMVLAKVINKVFPEYNSSTYAKKSTLEMWIELVLMFSVVLVGSRLIRHSFMKWLPSPFEGSNGYRRSMTKEAAGSVIFATCIFTYTSSLKDKMEAFAKRITL